MWDVQEKKPLSGYMLFCKHNREAAKKKIPSGLESKAVMPAIAKVKMESILSNFSLAMADMTVFAFET